MKVGDSIGGLFIIDDHSRKWELCESKVTKIVQNKKGTKVYSKRFYPLDLEEIEDATKVMEEAKGWINTRDVVWLKPELRAKCERWVEWANQFPEKAVGLISGQ